MLTTLKNLLRFLLGYFLLFAGLREFIRKVYINHSRKFVQKLDPQYLKYVWLRRSLTNQDFVPLLSDIDMTIVVSKEAITNFTLPQDFLLRDVQILPEICLKEWMEAGGYRNKTLSSWILLFPEDRPSFKIEVHNSRSLLAFDLAHEVYLLYHQLEEKFHQINDPLNQITKKKLISELLRIRTYWQDIDQTVPFLPRSKFMPLVNEKIFFAEHEAFCGKLLNKLKMPLNKFNFKDYLWAEHPNHYELNIHMRGKPVIVVKNPKDVFSFFKSHKKHFIATPNFFNLVKGVGVQEQFFLNKLAKDKNSYYFKFNYQRLITDLVSACIMNSKNQEQLYYCFKNIQDFVLNFQNQGVAGWEELNSKWTKDKRFYSDTSELQQLASQYIDVLQGL